MCLERVASVKSGTTPLIPSKAGLTHGVPISQPDYFSLLSGKGSILLAYKPSKMKRLITKT